MDVRKISDAKTVAARKKLDVIELNSLNAQGLSLVSLGMKVKEAFLELRHLRLSVVQIPGDSSVAHRPPHISALSLPEAYLSYNY
jgi:hypothetical protein